MIFFNTGSDIRTDKDYPNYNSMVMAVRLRLRGQLGAGSDAFREETRKINAMNIDELFLAATTANQIQGKIDRILMMRGLEGQAYEDKLQSLIKQDDETIIAEYNDVRAGLVRKLAKAVTGPGGVASPLLTTFEGATKEFSKLRDEDLAKRCAALDAMDHDDTIIAVAFDGEGQHFLHT